MEKPRTLSYFLEQIETISARIEDADELSDELISEFDAAKGDFQFKVDSCLGFIDAATASLAASDERFKKLERERKRLRTAIDDLKEHMTQMMVQSPDAPWRGTDERLVLKKNAASLDCIFPREKKSMSNVIDASFLNMDPDLAQYTETVTLHILDADRVKSKLKSGETFGFASLVNRMKFERKPIL